MILLATIIGISPYYTIDDDYDADGKEQCASTLVSERSSAQTNYNNSFFIL